jgi:opacity protein-like surface antigen
MKQLISFLLTFFLLLMPSLALAQHFQFYVGPKVGATYVFDEDLKIVNTGSVSSTQGELTEGAYLDVGIKAGMNFYPLPDWLFLEYEFGYFNKKGSYNLSQAGTAFGNSVSGKAANVDFDVYYNNFNVNFEKEFVPGLRPYAGVGLGLNIVDAELDFAPSDGHRIDDKEVTLGINFLGGLKIKTPIGWLFGEGRYFNSDLDVFNADMGFDGFSAYGGLLWYFGSRK